MYKRQICNVLDSTLTRKSDGTIHTNTGLEVGIAATKTYTCLLYTSDAADDPLCVDLGGRRNIKKKKQTRHIHHTTHTYTKKHTSTKSADTTDVRE